MTRSMFNALKATCVLVAISICCVGLLTVCNMFFPKYRPTLNFDTAKLINEICPTGKTSDEAFDDGYIVMLSDGDYDGDLAAFNKENRSTKAEVLAIYGIVKGDGFGSYVVECKATGRDSDVVMLIAFGGNEITGAVCKKQNESYFEKLPKNIFSDLTGVDDDVDLKGLYGKTGATISMTAIEKSVNLSLKFNKKYSASIFAAIEKISKAATEEKA